MKRRDKHQWMLDRKNDEFYIKAKKEGYKARSAYKLIEINKKFSIIPKAGKILDLGCAPGAWLQVLKKSSNADLFGIDLLKISNLDCVNFLQEDIFSKNTEQFLENLSFDLILCDIAPNCSGIKDIDHLKIMNLAEKVFEFVKKYLKLKSNFCIKLFDGKDVPEYIKNIRQFFEHIKIFKPKSSLLDSNEFYLICQSKK